MSVYVCMYMYFKVLGSTSLNLLAFKYSTSTWSFFKKYLSNYRVLHYLCLNVLKYEYQSTSPQAWQLQVKTPNPDVQLQVKTPDPDVQLRVKTPNPDVQLQVDN